ncbi:MAG: Rieske 2Fe-2S domain-containing protein [Acidobacteriia bacterium]|nr:Rieske 2Fe-2S domain-containing protein [Terriglobia bacterium]
MSEPKNPTVSSSLEKPEDKEGLSRRDFFNEIAAGALGVAGLGAFVVSVRYLSPNVLFEPPTNFRIGPPSDYQVNSVTYLANQEVYIVRTSDGLFAQSAICTHLGCITQWKPELEMIACPCHGSKFRKDGSVEHGPAPRPLQHFAVRMMPDGELMVDLLELVKPTQILKV